jgi:hypothetical protein
MASYVLLEFADDAEAERFVARTNGGRFAWVDPESLTMEQNTENAKLFRRRVLGIWRKPRKFCQCRGGNDKTFWGYVRGQRFGWWVHARCGRPSRAWGQGYSKWFSVLGTNLLPGNKMPVPQGYQTMLEDNATFSADVGGAEINQA